MNAHESDKLRAMLRARGFTEAAGECDADVLIFQTCSIRDTAARKIITHVNMAKKAREKKAKSEERRANSEGEKKRAGGKNRQIICVIGCLSAHVEFKGVDLVFGTNELDKVVEGIERETGNVKRETICGKRETGNGYECEDWGKDGLCVVINHGCDNYCAYCIVPYVRGREWSRDVDEVVAEFNAIVDKIKASKSPAADAAPPLSKGELPVIYLLGQNVNSYRCPRTHTDFVGLLDRLCKIDGPHLINFMSSHPKDFDECLVDCIARNEKIERNIHLPMQSGSTTVLARMNRRYTIDEYLAKINLLRTRVPKVRITTDIICGFVGETEAEYAETVEVVKSVKFNAAFIFPYSRRAGTAADTMPGHLDPAVIKRRTTALIELQRSLK